MFTNRLIKSLLILSVYFSTCLTVIAQAPRLSKQSYISLLTCSSGDELYSVFGHSAIRVVDDSLGYDIVFNYGTFDFNTPNFYLKFMRGDLNYMLASTSYDRFYRVYRNDNRAVDEGVLDLDQTQKQQLWDYLVWNIQPENRNYRYDFFFDNCATRIRDIVFKAKHIENSNLSEPCNDCRSFRDYIHFYVPEESWTAQGIDLLLGTKADKIANDFDRAYLPVYLDSLFVNKELFSKHHTVLEQQNIEVNNKEFMFTADMFGWSLLIFTLLICLLENRKKSYIKSYDVILFTSVSLLSLLFWFLWLFTKHTVCSSNLNVLWASVLYLPMIVLLLMNKMSSLLIKISAYVNIGLVIVFILLSILSVQDTPSMTIPISIALLIRNAVLVRGAHNR